MQDLTGYLSPSLGLKFTDVPGGLAAISKVPACILETAMCVMGIYMDLWFVTLWLYDTFSY